MDLAKDQVRLCLLDQVIEEFMLSHMDTMPPNALDDPASRSRRQRAADAIAQYKLMEYVREVNMKQGIAPTSEQLLVRLTQAWPFDEATGIENTGKRVSAMTAGAQRRWMAAWRERFGVTYGRLPPGSDLTEEVIEKQATEQKRGTQKREPGGHATRGKTVLRYPFLGTKIGPIFGTRDAKKKWPKTGSTFGYRVKAHAFWAWANFLTDRTPQGKTPLFINLDETSMPLGLGSLKGNRMPRMCNRKGAGAGHDRLPSNQKLGGIYIFRRCSSSRLASGVHWQQAQAHQEGDGSAAKLGESWPLASVEGRVRVGVA